MKVSSNGNRSRKLQTTTETRTPTTAITHTAGTREAMLFRMNPVEKKGVGKLRRMKIVAAHVRQGTGLYGNPRVGAIDCLKEWICPIAILRVRRRIVQHNVTDMFPRKVLSHGFLLRRE